MKKSNTLRRIVSWMLILAMVLAYQLPISATNANDLTLTQVDNSAVSDPIRPQAVEEETQKALYEENEVVRVSIVLDKRSTLDAGFSTQGIAENRAAMAWRTDLYNQQAAVTAKIEDAIGQDLDVCWNLTLAANMISANVKYGQVDEISQIPGVEKVVLEPRYEPQEATSSAADKPNMVVSTNMTGTTQVWESGYTGGGTRIAIVDTGLDTDHQSFDPDALVYALKENAKLKNLSYEAYLEQLNMLDVDEIAEKLPQLNVAKRDPNVTAKDLYLNVKSPFAYNYIDKDLDVTHDNDSASEHGSHVAGIAAANRYIKRDGTFVSAADAVGTLGNAPDSQIITMKVFGKNGGAYPSDYMAAIEDAIILDCDTVNLSLGSSSPGFTSYAKYQELLDYLEKTDVVVAMAAGNAGYWAEHSTGAAPNLYVEDVNFQTAGSPATYDNSFAVASVNNDGSVGASLRVGDVRFGYGEGNGSNNKPMSSLDPTQEGTEFDYVFLDSYGKEEDYAGIDVSGKIVFVSRGDINFADKADNAVKKGAVATVVYNDQAAGISMNLQGYVEEAPCVLITQAKGQIVKEHSTKATTDAGVTYYTGKVTVCSQLTANMEGSDFYSMSAFSSWGIPGDLSMKPEITAPGGNIYSVNGAVPETDQYELMSGTSMATPQVAGIAALVQQHIKEQHLSQEGLTDRALTQSLLMSTARPLKDANGQYYPIMQQGAGLTDTLAATSADSYVLVNGQSDGKVKVELGDDPDRNGSYSFSFKLNNLADEEKVFQLSADLFTQDTFESFANVEAKEAGDTSKMATYLDNATISLDADVQWSADGKLVSSADSLSACDFDGNGKVDEDDAQALLDYVTGARKTIENLDHADISGDQKVNTYDVHVMLAKLTDKAVVVPANGTVEVSVTMTLDEAEKERLDATYVNGAYIQAFVYADAIADSEGVEGTCHSIPVLGFYGNWTDSPMFEVGTAQTHVSGQEIRDPYMGSDTVNSLTVEYARDTGSTYLLGGNPITPDSVYKPERNAFNNVNGDKIDALKFSPIRNVGASRVQVINKTTGKTIRDESAGPITGPYYGFIMFMELWLESMQRYPFRWIPKDVSEGDTLEFSITLAPEYYLDGDNVDWDALGKGATLTIPVTIDNTAPKIEEVSLNLINNTLSIDAIDNQYVAGIGLWNSTGTNLITYTGSVADTETGQTNRYTIDLSKANGSKFLIQVYDYAYNTTTYELKMDLGDVPTPPQMLAFDRQYDYYWTGFDTNASYANLTIYSNSDVVFNAATIANHYAFGCSDTGELYVMPENDLADMTRIRNLGVVLSDMAYDSKSQTLYGLSYDEEAETSTLYTINKVDGAMTEVGTVGLKTNTLACNGSGVFYCNEYGTSKVYSFTLDTLAEPEFMVECKTEKDKPFTSMGAQAMEYNTITQQVVWTSHYYESYPWGKWSYSYLFEIDPDTNACTLHDDLRHQLTALIIPQRDAGGDWMDPTDKVTSLELSHETLSILKGTSKQLTATILPWTVTDRSVTWSTKDETIATVNEQGLVTAVKPGTTTITAVSNLDPTFTAEVQVTVEALPITVNGALQDDKGTASLFSWDVAKEDHWSAGVKLDTDLLAATQNGKGTMYVTSGNGADMKAVDMTTGTSTKLGTWNQPMDDMAYSSVFSSEKQDLVHMVYSYMWVPAKDLAHPENDECWNLFKYINEASGASEFLAIASGGACTYKEEDGKEHDAEILYLLDNKGYLCKLFAYADGDSYNAGLEFYPTNLMDVGYKIVHGDNDECPASLVVGQDGNLYFSGWNGKTSVFYKMTLNEEAKAYDVVSFAETGEDVWPAALLDVVPNEKAEKEAAVYTTEITLSEVAEKMHLADAVEKEAQAEDTVAMAASLMTDVVLSDTVSEEPVTLESLAVRTEKAEEPSHTVAVTVTAKDAQGKNVDATNGLFTATYDAEKMVLKSVESNAHLTATVNAAGSVTLGYADEKAIPAGNAVATLIFAPKTEGTADVTITTNEVNDTELEFSETINVTLPKACPSARFEDIAMDKWYHEAVDYAVEHEYMNGTGATTFSPFSATTRGQMVTVLYRMAGSPEVEGKLPFVDVPQNKYYTNAVTWALENNITTGVTETRFAPNASVTREQMVTFFARYAEYKGQTVKAAGDLSTFTDAASVSNYAVPAMTWAVENGLVVGVGDNQLAPTHVTNRAQFATILMRFCELQK